MLLTGRVGPALGEDGRVGGDGLRKSTCRVSAYKPTKVLQAHARGAVGGATTERIEVKDHLVRRDHARGGDGRKAVRERGGTGGVEAAHNTKDRRRGRLHAPGQQTLQGLPESALAD